jgi:surface protein
MKLVERETGLPLDLVVLINSFLYERLPVADVTESKFAFLFVLKPQSDGLFEILICETSRVTNMEGTFYNRSSFNEDISQWDVSRVTDMWRMFNEASQFNQGIAQWDVSNVTHMGSMFLGASQFNQDIGQWNVSNVTKMTFMFYGAVSYEGVRWV